MKQFKRTFALLLAAVSMLAFLAACGAPAEESTSTNGDTSTPQTEDGGDATEGAYSGELVVSVHNVVNNTAFLDAVDIVMATDKWKNVTIDMRPQDNEYATNFPIQVAGGETIDVMYNFNPIEQAKMSDAGVIIPMDEYVAELGINLEERYGTYASGAYTEGQVFGIPGGATAWGMFYNKKIFDDAGIDYPDATTPMTWTEYRALAAELTTGEGSDKIYGALHLDWPMYWYSEAIMTLGGGQNFYTADGLSNIEDPAFADALQDTYNMQNVDMSIPKLADILATQTGPEAFFTGNYAMYPHGTWTLNWIADTETYPRDWEIGFCPLPIPDGTTQRQTWGVVGTFGLPATVSDPIMATEWIVDVVAETTKLSSSEIYPDQSVTADNLFVEVVELIEDEQFTTEAIQDLFLSPDQLMILEKVSGPNAAQYETVINEEVGMYLGEEQDLETTIANIKERGDAAILDS